MADLSPRSVVGWFALPAALAVEAHSRLLDGGTAELLGQVGDGQFLRFGRKLVGTTKAGEVRRAGRGSRKGRTRAVPELAHHLLVEFFIGLLDTRRRRCGRQLIRTADLRHDPALAVWIVLDSINPVWIDAVQLQQDTQILPAFPFAP